MQSGFESLSPSKKQKLDMNISGFCFSVGTGTRKTEAAKPAVATAVAESGSRLFLSDDEEKSRDRVHISLSSGTRKTLSIFLSFY